MKRLIFLIILILTLVACDAFTEMQQEDINIMQSGDSETVTVDNAAEAETMTVAYNGPAWTSLPLTNAHTGETFTFADFAGKTVFVEPMATWCSNCRNQQRQVITAKEDFGDDVVFVSLSVENGLSNDRLAQYSVDNGFNWMFAVVTPEMLSALVNQYGRSVTVPPSTPHFLIAPDGTVSELSTGQHGADDITMQINDIRG